MLLVGEPESIEVLGDSAYGSGKNRADIVAAGHAATIKPIPLPPLPAALRGTTSPSTTRPTPALGPSIPHLLNAAADELAQLTVLPRLGL